MNQSKIEPGDIVSTGKPGTDGYDVGDVVSVEDDVASVAWSGGAIITSTDLDDLVVLARRDDPPHARRQARQEAWAFDLADREES